MGFGAKAKKNTIAEWTDWDIEVVLEDPYKGPRT